MTITLHKNPRAILVAVIAAVVLGILAIGWWQYQLSSQGEPHELRQEWLALHTFDDHGDFEILENWWREVDLPQIEAYIQAGTDVQVKISGDYADHTPLHWAVRHNTAPPIIAALVTAGADVHAKDSAGYTPLHHAAKSSSEPAVIHALVKVGADVQAKNHVIGHAPIHVAAKNSAEPAIIDVLIKVGADVHATNTMGNTPIHVAARRNANLAIIDALITAGADVHATNVIGNTPLHVAAWHNSNPAIIEALIKNGADVQAKDNLFGKTPLELLGDNDEMSASDKARARAMLQP